MFVVIYRWYAKPGFEEACRRSWKEVAAYFVKERGALGSTLHRADDGMWVAYSKWPDRATRDASWPRDQEAISSEIPLPMRQAIERLKQCQDEERLLPDICMEVEEEVYLGQHSS